MKPTKINSFIGPIEFISRAVAIRTEKAMKALLDVLPIADEQRCTYDQRTPESGWTAGKLRALRLLGNLADRRTYDYTDDQVSSILRALYRDYRALRSRFAGGLRCRQRAIPVREGVLTHVAS